MSNSLSLPGSQLPSADSHSSRETEQYLRFYLEPDTNALLPILQLAEVLNVPIAQIVPIAHMPAWVMGVYNWRGEILWMVDLGHLVGLTPCYQQAINTSTYTTIVLQATSKNTKSTKAKSQMLGVIVNRIEDIEWCDSHQIQSPPSSTITPELLPFLRGYWLKSDDDMLAVLDGEAVIAAMPKPDL
ncbi:MAG: purine-binding chemotaxis protein CheW [Symploca sp. SIO3C6]|nr:purine-binding chemotaxis protein CheW [Symploca sp. SIO3C6]